MHIFRLTGLFLGLLAAGVFAVPVLAQQDSGTAAPSTDQAAPAPAPAPKKQHKPKPKPPGAPNAAAPGAPAAPAATGTAAPAAAVAVGAKPTLLGQYGEWGAYSAAP